MKKFLLSSICLFGLWTFCHGQSMIIPNYSLNSGSHKKDVGISSPQVWSFMKYGGNTPNHYTGTVSASIPIYTYKDDDFTLPISLGYASNGYLPNVQASDVGLGWFLNVGGYITKTIRGVPDEIYGEHVHGYAFCSPFQSYTNQEITLSQSESRIVEFDNAYIYTQNGSSGKTETEPDIYAFNFMGHTGNFTLSGPNVFVFNTAEPAGEYQVNMRILNPTTATNPYKIPEITITTGDGYKYSFVSHPFENKGIKRITNNTHSLQHSPVKVDTCSYSDKWVLSKITAPNGRNITLTYKNNDKCDVENYLPGGEKTYTDTSYGNIDPTTDVYVISYKERTAQLSKINIDDLVQIQFNYGERRPERSEFSLGYNGEILTPERLDSIVVTSHQRPLKKCNLSYVYGRTNPVMFLNSVTIPGEGTYKMEYHNQFGHFPIHGTVSMDHWGYYNSEPAYNPDLLLPDFLTEPSVSITKNRRTPNDQYAMRGILTKMTYPTGGYSTFEYESHQYSSHVTRSVDSLNIPFLELRPSIIATAGGVRIKKITDYSITNPPVSRVYTYKTSNGSSSGILLHNPIYYREETTNVNGDLQTKCIYTATDLCAYYTDKTHIEYSEVTEHHDDGSRVVYNFSNYATSPDLFQTRKDGIQNPNIQYANSDLACGLEIEPDYLPQSRGKLLSMSYYDKDNKPAKKYKLTYKESDIFWPFFPSAPCPFVESVKPAADRFVVHRTYLKSLSLYKVEIEEFRDRKSFLTEYIYEYNQREQIIKQQTTNGDGTKITDHTTYVGNAPEEYEHLTMIETNVVNLPLSTKKTISSRTSTSADSPEVINAQENKYTVISGAIGNKMIRPLKHKEATIDTPQPFNTPLTYITTTSYDVYDSMGRLCQYTDRNGLQTCFIWDNNDIYPDAKIIGTDLQKLQFLYDNATGKLYSDWRVRIHRATGMLATLYEYEQGVGITKITDPSARSISFQYNSTGKLIKELDENGRTLRSYTYSTDIN